MRSSVALLVALVFPIMRCNSMGHPPTKLLSKAEIIDFPAGLNPNPMNTIDDKLNTDWKCRAPQGGQYRKLGSTGGDGSHEAARCSIKYHFNYPQNIKKIGIAFKDYGESGSTYHRVKVIKNKNREESTVLSSKRSHDGFHIFDLRDLGYDGSKWNFLTLETVDLEYNENFGIKEVDFYVSDKNSEHDVDRYEGYKYDGYKHNIDSGEGYKRTEKGKRKHKDNMHVRGRTRKGDKHEEMLESSGSTPGYGQGKRNRVKRGKKGDRNKKNSERDDSETGYGKITDRGVKKSRKERKNGDKDGKKKNKTKKNKAEPERKQKREERKNGDKDDEKENNTPTKKNKDERKRNKKGEERENGDKDYKKHELRRKQKRAGKGRKNKRSNEKPKGKKSKRAQKKEERTPAY